MRKTAALLFGALMLAAFAAQAAGPSVSASRVWIREAPPGAEVMAGFLVLTNHTGAALTLANVTSPDFGSVAVQHKPQAGGAPLAIPAHQSVTLAPGGDQLLLRKPSKPLYDGDLVTLTFNFSDGSALTIMAPVRQDAPTH